MKKKKKIKFSKEKHDRNNMKVVVFKFPPESVNLIKNKIVLTEKQKSDALDKILNANPNYLELPPEEQNGLIVTTLTLESVFYWLLNSGEIKNNVTMYQAYIENAEIAVIELFYVDNKKNADIINNAFKGKSEKVFSLPRKKISGEKKNKKPAKIIDIRKE